MKKIKQWLHAGSAEILLVLGAFLIVGATVSISTVAAVYLTGGALMSLGIFIVIGRGDKNQTFWNDNGKKRADTIWPERC